MQLHSSRTFHSLSVVVASVPEVATSATISRKVSARLELTILLSLCSTFQEVQVLFEGDSGGRDCTVAKKGWLISINHLRPKLRRRLVWG